jgi:hypothetical protein
VDAFDHFSTLPWESLITRVGIVVMVVSALLMLGALVLRRARSLKLEQDVLTLDGKTWAGWRIALEGSGKTLTLTCPHKPPAGTSIYFHTKSDSSFDQETLQAIETGIAFIDFVFPVRAASQGVGECLAANQLLLARQVPFLRGWLGRLKEIEITDTRVHIVFRTARRGQVREALPGIVAFASAICSASWWYPPPARAELESPYRGHIDVDPKTPLWRLEQPGLEPALDAPISLLELIEHLREGTVSWLSRVEVVDRLPLATLASLTMLQGLVVAAAESGGGQAKPATAPRRLWWRLYHTAQLLGALPLCFAIGAVGCECSRPWENARLGKASLTWPSAEGVVVESGVTHRSMSEGGEKYKPFVLYRYEVKSQRAPRGTELGSGVQTFEGRRIHFHYNWSFEGHYKERAEAERIIAPYAPGARVEVFYDPAAPQRSTLEKGPVTIELVKAGIGVALASLFALLLVGLSLARLAAWRARRRATP